MRPSTARRVPPPVLSATLLLASLLPGCGRTEADLPTKPLTPAEYYIKSDMEKFRYKNITVRVPGSWGGVLLPEDAGPWGAPIWKAVHWGDVTTIMGLYNQALFELQHPRVKLEYIQFDMWSDNFKSALAVALKAKRAPAYYIARDLPQTIEQGLYADLTPLMKKWDQYELQPEGSRREGTYNGRIYTLAGNELGATIIKFRKDWFREAGILNERGEPGPPLNWTWDDFRRIAKRLTDPARKRYGYAAAIGGFSSVGYLYYVSSGLDTYVPDPTGKRTWVFNDKDPEMLRSLEIAREMVARDRSVLTSVSYGWTQWHSEFDASRAAMIAGFSPHPAREFLESPYKLGKDKPYGETVGMVPLPGHPSGYTPLRPVTNPIGFDPTLKPEELEAAFEWCKSWFYGDVFVNRVRAAADEARAKNRGSSLYVEMLCLPYKPKVNVLDKPLEEVFPPDYMDFYRRVRESHAPPLPREFGLREPPTNEMERALKAMYSEACTSNVDLRDLLRRTAALINNNLLNYRNPQDSERLRRWLDARTRFFKRWFPRYHDTVWQPRLAAYYRVP